MDYPNSPYHQVRRLVSELVEGRISADQFLDRLALLEQRLENWYSQLETLRPGGDCQEGVELVEAAQESLRAVYEGLEMLREFPESRSQESVDAALELLREASQYMADLVALTERNTAELQTYQGSLFEGLFG
ncbi:MAG: hypothetical protein HY319_18950 [Armatimonadetes bacterium]|nr:hypothetical protein [Armatimonadota bacterium]